MTLLAEPPKPAPVAPSKPRRSPLLSFGFIAAVLALVVAVVIVVVVVNQSNSFKQANPGSVTSVSVP